MKYLLRNSFSFTAFSNIFCIIIFGASFPMELNKSSKLIDNTVEFGSAAYSYNDNAEL